MTERIFDISPTKLAVALGATFVVLSGAMWLLLIAPKQAAATVSPPTRGPAAAKPTPKPAANAGGPVGRMQAKLATAVNEDPDWKEF